MRVLITGRGTSGSWKIRGQQLGAAIGATVIPNASAADIEQADIVVIVKRADKDLVDHVHAARKPLVYDVLDSWPQPQGNDWDRGFIIAKMGKWIEEVNPAAIIFPTQRMMGDLWDGTPTIALPHHARPDLAINSVREMVKTVGYEGSEAYLGGWRSIIENECKARGWSFSVNPKSLIELDIVVALRGGIYNGYAPRSWKSNVKLANAQGSGTPGVFAPEAGYLETECGAEYWATTPAELSIAFDWLTPYETRKAVSERFLRAAPRLEAVAETYRQFLQGLC